MNSFSKFFILSLLIPCFGYAQTFNSLGLEQGLSNDNVNVIFKDSFGFMWFGTFDGLNRFDGYAFTKFRNKIGDSTSLPDKEVYAVAEDRNRYLLIGTSKGVGILDNKSLLIKRLKFHFDGSHSDAAFTGDRINDIKVDQEDNDYIASYNTGLLVLRKGETVATAVSLKGTVNQRYTASSIVIDGSKGVWVLVDQMGICYYSFQTKTLSLISTFEIFCNSMTGDAQGNLWIGTNNGLYQYNINRKLFVLFKVPGTVLDHSRIYKVKFDAEGKLWIATDGDGLFKLNLIKTADSQIFKHQPTGSISSNVVHDIFFDNQARKWIATLGAGVNIIDARRNQFSSVIHQLNDRQSMLESPVYAVAEDAEKRIWIGTVNAGLSIWNRETGRFTNYIHSPADPRSLSNNGVSAIVKDDKNEMWIGTHGGGVQRFDQKTGRFIQIPFVQKDNGLKYIVKLFMDREHRMWATCIKGRLAGRLEKGLYLFEGRIGKFVQCDFPVDQELFSIDQCPNGDLVMGSLKNLFIVNPTSQKTRVIPIGSIIRTVHVSKNGLIWIGTYDKGLLCLNPQNAYFRSYTENDGLCNNTILNIEEDGQRKIWVSTFNGLSRLDYNTGKIDNFYAEDGLQSDQFCYNASAHFSTGELAFGGIKGLSYFQPQKIIEDKTFPMLATTNIRVANDLITAESGYTINSKSIYDVENIQLPYDKAILSIDYVALEYSQPGKIKYAYFLEGRDKGWNYVGSIRNINYSRLNEGKYLLRIKSTNSYGIWNNQEKHIAITVLPPWYRTWLAWFNYLVALVVGVYFYNKYRVKQAQLKFEIVLSAVNMAKEKAERQRVIAEFELEKTEHEKEKLVNEKEKEINDKRLSFFTNISHEFRTPLTLIINPAKAMIERSGGKLSGNDNEINVIHRNAKRLLSLVDQLLHFRKADSSVEQLFPVKLNLYGLCHEAFLCFTQQANSKQVSYDFIFNNSALEIYADRVRLEIILYNLLSNAFKYTPAGGSIVFAVQENDADVVVEISDSGSGISPGEGERIFNKFYQAQDRAGKVQPGFGIGLYLVKQFAEAQGGSISYSSEEGLGTVFTLKLLKGSDHFKEISSNEGEVDADLARLDDNYPPIMRELFSIDGQVIADPAPNPYESELFTERKFVLVADDDDDFRKYTADLFSKNYGVYEANSGEDGLSMAKRYLPDIIVSDITMDGISGIDFCKAIKDDPATAHIPVILLTGTSSPELKLEGVEGGADDYITKPFEKDYLLARVTALLNSRNKLQNYFYNRITHQSIDSMKVSAEYKEFIEKCMAIVEQYIDDSEFNVTTLLQEIGMSHSNLYRRVKSVSGVSVTAFIRLIRLRKAAEIMLKRNYNVNEISAMVGFNSPNYFRTQFHKLFDMTPSAYIKKYRNVFGDEFSINSGNFNKYRK